MARSYKAGKRRWRDLPGKGECKGVFWAKLMRHTYGSTEKILRRNRKLWERLAAKRRRAVDKESVAEGLV